uniref:Dihydrolipoyllysine-residue succinyltransferase component of 2-oxoglutarate dehydrogenase complex, mitochondrial n=1 Tax=Glossina austeni TaxID=7395 RepID=A0A1A9VT06_GLOAU
MSSLISITTRRLPHNVLFLGMQAARSQEVKTASLARKCSRLVSVSANIWKPVSELVTANGARQVLCLSVVTNDFYFSVFRRFADRGTQYIHTSADLWSKQTVNVPPFPESVSEGDIKFTTKVGDQVSVDQVVMEVETDKTAVPVPAPFNGVIREILVKDGDSVKSGQALFVIEQMAGGVAPAPKPAAAAAAKPAAGGTVSPPKPAAAKSPAAAPPQPTAAPPPPRPSASAPPPSPPKPVTPVAAIPRAQAAQVKIPPADYSREITGTRTEQRVKMNRMRQKIAARLKEAQNVNAMLTTFNEIDMSAAMEFRKTNLEAFTKKYGIKIGFMSIFTKASAYALQDQPVEIVYRDYVDISVAVATPKGLVVPVIRNVEGMNYADIEIAMAALGEKARKGAITVEDMDGGTFTISNGGVFGSLMGTPIINPPQSAILGMHGIFERPIAVKGQVVIRPMMYVALTYDHRLIDGREAVMFLRKIKAAVEDPKIMLAGL